MGERAKRAPRSWRAVRPAVYPVARRERDAAPPGPPRKSSRGRAAILANQANTTRPARRFAGNRFDSENLARMMTVPLRTKQTTRTAHRARARGWFPSFTTRATRQRRDIMSQEGGVSARCAATVPAATHAPKPHPTSSFFVILCACPGIFARKKTRRRDPRSARARALVADTPILPPAPDPPAVARAPSSRAPRPSAAALPRPRARANAHRKTDGSSAKRPRQRRGSRAMAPRGGRACRAFHKNTGWNPTRGNL